MDFYREWRQESNPWREAHKSDAEEEGGKFVTSFLWFLATFAVLNVAGQFLGKMRPESPLSARPTVLAGTFHALATSMISIYLLVVRPHEEEAPTIIDWSMWQTVGIPLSLAYFAADAVWYCLPRSDGLIFFHHIIIISVFATIPSSIMPVRLWPVAETPPLARGCP